jgi:hypothetical protein
MPNPMPMDDIIKALQKMRKDLDFLARRLDVLSMDLMTHVAATSRKATKKKKKL